MKLLDIAVEIRLVILSELLVLPKPIEFSTNFGPSSLPLFRRQKYGLWPAILRVCKTLHHEASPLLYSENQFQFPEVFISTPSASTSAYISPFLYQIGFYGRLLRHICIPFPTFDYPQPTKAVLSQAHIENLELIRHTCTGVQTLELVVPPEHSSYALSESTIAVQSWDLLDIRFKNITPLRKIIVHFQLYPSEDLDDDIKRRMDKYGWITRTTKLPPKTWTSVDDRFEFDDEEDCQAYDNEYVRKEWEAEEAAEEEMWLEEYYRRRNDPYWKNDSDYD